MFRIEEHHMKIKTYKTFTIMSIIMFYVTICLRSCTNIKNTLVVHTIICTTENYPLYSIYFVILYMHVHVLYSHTDVL